MTDDAAKAKASKKAGELGLTKFYNSNKGKTSTVAVLQKNKVKYITSNNTNKADYTAAIDKALK